VIPDTNKSSRMWDAKAVAFGINQPTIRSLRNEIPDVQEIDGTTMDSWGGRNFVEAVQEDGTQKIGHFRAAEQTPRELRVETDCSDFSTCGRLNFPVHAL
jgi:hypothetical protein